MPAAETASWHDAGLVVVGLRPEELAARETLPTPGIAARADLASATRSPWVFANGSRYLRQPTRQFAYDVARGQAASLAAAEAYAYGGDALLRVDGDDLEALGEMLAFLRQVPLKEAPAVADLGVVDDGSPLLGEVLNLLVRRNLLFRPVAEPSSEFRINVQLGTPKYPKADAADPSAFALKVRRELTDEERAVRVYGSEVVVCRVMADGQGARVHLLNYGGREIDGLRIRLRGDYPQGSALVPGLGRVALEELASVRGTTEFSLPRMGVYAVVDLSAGK